MDKWKDGLMKVKELLIEAENKKFCGPNQTYPSSTYEEAEASMKEAFRARMDGKQKSRIMKCLSRRLKELGCRRS